MFFLLSLPPTLWHQLETANDIGPNTFNNIFANIETCLAKNKSSKNRKLLGHRVLNSFVFGDITTKEVVIAIKNLIVLTQLTSSKVLKLLLTVISLPLANLFNRCFFEGHYPKFLKKAKFLPL